MDILVCSFIVIILLILQVTYYRVQETMKKRYFLFQIGTILLMNLLFLIKTVWLGRAITLSFVMFTIALIFSFIGDLFMARILRITSKKLLDGMIGFGLAHIMYIIGIVTLLDSEHLKLYMTGIALLLIFLGEIAYYVIASVVENKKLRYGGMIYALLLLSVTGLSLLVMWSHFTTRTLTLFVGSIMFLASDFLIALREFRLRDKKPLLNNFIHPLYIFGQFFMQVSIIFLSI